MVKLVNNLFSNENRTGKKNKTKNEKTQTIVDGEALIEPTRPSYKHLRARV